MMEAETSPVGLDFRELCYLLQWAIGFWWW